MRLFQYYSKSLASFWAEPLENLAQVAATAHERNHGAAVAQPLERILRFEMLIRIGCANFILHSVIVRICHPVQTVWSVGMAMDITYQSLYVAFSVFVRTIF